MAPLASCSLAVSACSLIRDTLKRIYLLTRLGSSGINTRTIWVLTELLRLIWVKRERLVSSLLYLWCLGIYKRIALVVTRLIWIQRESGLLARRNRLLL
jgi:hypothetical protein